MSLRLWMPYKRVLGPSLTDSDREMLLVKMRMNRFQYYLPCCVEEPENEGLAVNCGGGCNREEGEST